jgi:hypothetical protein
MPLNHPSWYKVIQNQKTREMFRLDTEIPVPAGFDVVVKQIPIPEKYWGLPRYGVTYYGVSTALRETVLSR